MVYGFLGIWNVNKLVHEWFVHAPTILDPKLLVTYLIAQTLGFQLLANWGICDAFDKMEDWLHISWGNDA